jgi:hypothetical protein
MSATATEAIARQPDIAYTPDYAKYQARTRLRLQTEPLKQKRLPTGLPQILHSDFVWEGQGLADKYNWTYELTAAQVEELEDALRHFKCL